MGRSVGWVWQGDREVSKVWEVLAPGTCLGMAQGCLGLAHECLGGFARALVAGVPGQARS